MVGAGGVTSVPVVPMNNRNDWWVHTYSQRVYTVGPVLIARI